MKRIRRLIELDTRAVMWLLDLLGAWRLDVAWFRAWARINDGMGARAQADGLHQLAAVARTNADRYRAAARDRTPVRRRP
jgi:hypothetical protein